MRILVYPHDLGIGGSQLNAVEIASEVGRLGHEVVVYGRPGPLIDHIADLGLELIVSPPPSRRPSRAVVDHLGRIIDQRRIDVAHGYEWPPGLESYWACRQRPATTAVTTVMSMAVAPFLPRSMPVVVGTEQIAASEDARGRKLVSVIEPPVDIGANRPSASVEARDELCARWGLRPDRPIVVAVTRLARQLKLEGLLTAIDTIVHLHPDRPAQLLVVGDGEARCEVEERARWANEALGCHAVVLTGELADPRPAYDAADICLAMGGSALRSMAFAKPLIVQGEAGFFRLLTPETLPEFLWTGWYGHGTTTGNPVGELAILLRGLLRDPVRRLELGSFGRSVVEDRFSLAAAGRRQVEVYESAVEGRGGVRRLPDELASGASFARYQLTRRARRLLGVRAADDFNARPVARDGKPR
jgi:glycosyltransferase involved in cell wall biosynthesis